ncbi:protein of unknown function DUF107 [Ignisphaera aggregans DSM 17230]|uniref:Uncharacterized protein n=1 Tax=Ignisphaera aggregans (strain DSM 17230 / JCM 13409 / AQ1.S1) TaxID=583356 RepID=E0SRL5_IGNAA|nr:protein of unknown function DUF107 [Ignisphaera aggregans DSM 17230]
MRTAIVILILFITLISIPHAMGLSSKKALILEIDDTIDGGMASYISRNIEGINISNAIVILSINSYGGYLASADEIINKILSSGIECYSWIPPGGKAVSAAALIALSCRDIYMAPGTVFGGMLPYPSDEKVLSYVESRALSLVERRMNITDDVKSLIRSMVRDGKSYTAEELRNIGFIKMVYSLDDVLRDLGVSSYTVARRGIGDKFLSILSNTVISSLLLATGILLIIIEVLTTGFQGYGIAGVIAIALALYGMHLVPPDIIVLTILLSGIVLIAIELHTPGFGAFGIAGTTLLVIGVVLGIYFTPPELRSEAMYSIVSGLLIFSGLMIFIAVKASSVLRIRRPSLSEKLMNSIGIAKTDVYENSPGVVYILNEEWTAYSVKGVIKAGSKVKVVRVEGLKLYVEEVR